jgi:hypothetical protein
MTSHLSHLLTSYGGKNADVIWREITSSLVFRWMGGYIYFDDWKRARVIPVYKTEDRTKCENYRPISILPIIRKLFEKEVFGQLYQYLIDNSLLSRFQSGFRPKHSTMSLFDSIDHKILLRKMQDQFGVQDFELKWFQSYLTKRSQVCVVDSLRSRRYSRARENGKLEIPPYWAIWLVYAITRYIGINYENNNSLYYKYGNSNF